MFKYHYGQCSHEDHEGSDEVLIVVKKGWCAICNYSEKQKKKKNKLSMKPKKSPEKRFKGSSGEYKLFLKIFAQCKGISWVSGKRLLGPEHPKFHWQFAHILSKGAYPKFKLYERNIKPMLPEEHEAQENGSWKGWSVEKKADWLQIAELLKCEYYNQ